MGVKIRNSSGGSVELEASSTITTDEKCYLAPMTDELKTHLAAGGAMPDWDGIAYKGSGTIAGEVIYPNGVIKGDNNNVLYTLYPDGLYVVRGVVLVTFHSVITNYFGTTSGNVNVGTADVNFPRAFVAFPLVISSSIGYGIKHTYVSNIGLASATVFGLYMETTSGLSITWQATGRWK